MLGIYNFVLCGMYFLAVFYSRDLILEMVPFRYINMFGLFIVYIIHIYIHIYTVFVNDCRGFKVV
jgi:hypothetical protein